MNIYPKINVKRKDRREEMNNNYEVNKINSLRKDLSSGDRLNAKSNIMIGKNIVLSKNEDFATDKKRLKLSSSFNIFELLICKFFSPCMTKNLSLKKILNVKAFNILYKELDIALYARNMIILDIMNRILLEDHNKDISKFISRPILSLYKEDEKYYDNMNRNYCEEDFNNFYGDASELIQRPQKSKIETKLVSILTEKLNGLL